MNVDDDDDVDGADDTLCVGDVDARDGHRESEDERPKANALVSPMVAY